MPPKKAAPSKKTEQKKKEKIVEDKTFGLKNKKGAKQQKAIQQVQKNVQHSGNPLLRKQEEVKKKSNDKKRENEQQKEFLKEIFKPVVEKVDKSVDPKSVVCPFFKQGVCDKGAKCKYAHDLSVARKTEKRNIYVDSRDASDPTADGITCDEAQLRSVIDSKHADADASKPRTQIICKYFLEAVESNKYGWFWECPSGEKCIYRHALPEGYVLKRDQKKPEKKDTISIEDLIEKERAALGSELTKITYATFLEWKKKKLIERRKENALKNAKKKKDFKCGKSTGLSGRDMFLLNPEMKEDEIEEGDENVDLTQREEHEDNQYKAWTLKSVEQVQLMGVQPGGATAAAAAAAADIQIDEDLFNEISDDDLDGLDDELQQLEV